MNWIRRYNKAIETQSTKWLKACFNTPSKYMSNLSFYLIKQELIKRS